MATKINLTKNKPYDGIRLTVTASSGASTYQYVTEAIGNRNYVSAISSTNSLLESVSFNAYLSFTSSGTQSYSFNLIPMEYGSTAMIETTVIALNQYGTKGYTMKAFGGFRHSGATLSAIGGSLNYITTSDFTSASASFTQSSTASVVMNFTGQTSETIDWSVYIKYSKNYHTLVVPTGGGGVPWYPRVEDNIL